MPRAAISAGFRPATRCPTSSGRWTGSRSTRSRRPIRTPFGWHIIQVLERRKQDITLERRREQARLALRQRKSDEGFQEFVRQLRDRAYVEYRLDDR